MNSLVLRTAAGILKPLMLLFSVFLLLRGHNEPGGGFVGGLVAAAGFCLDAFALSPADARRSLGVNPRILIAVGLLVAMASGLPAWLFAEPYLTGHWGTFNIPVVGEAKIGTPLFFDVGVYLVVVGVVLTFVLTLMQEQD